MSYHPARIVYTAPPGTSPAPRRATVVDKRPQIAPEPPAVALTSSTAIDAFLRAAASVEARAGSLTPDQIARVQHLMAIDAGMRTIHGDDVGEWMATGNGAAMLFRSSPIDILTHARIVGYAALAWQVGIWARM